MTIEVLRIAFNIECTILLAKLWTAVVAGATLRPDRDTSLEVSLAPHHTPHHNQSDVSGGRAVGGHRCTHDMRDRV